MPEFEIIPEDVHRLSQAFAKASEQISAIASPIKRSGIEPATVDVFSEGESHQGDFVDVYNSCSIEFSMAIQRTRNAYGAIAQKLQMVGEVYGAADLESLRSIIAPGTLECELDHRAANKNERPGQ